MWGVAEVAAGLALMSGWVAAVVVLRMSRGHAVRGPLAAGLAAFAAAAALSTPLVHDVALSWVRASGAVGAASIVLEVVGAYCMVVMLIRSSAAPSRMRQRIREQTGLLVGCLVALAALRADGALGMDPLYGVGDPLASVGVVAVWFVYLAVALGGFVALTGRLRRQPETDALVRAGLRIASMGALAGLCHIVVVLSAAVGIASHTVLVHQMSSVLLSACVLGFAAGATLTGWLPALRVWLLYGKAWYARWRLRPLHAMLTEHAPSTSGGPAPTAADRWDEPVFGLLRQVIGIRDAQRALRRVRHPHAAQWARELAAERGMDKDTSELLAEAAELATALQVADGAAAPDDGGQAQEPRVTPVGSDRRRWARRAGDAPPPPHSVPDVLAESRRLRAIYQALRHSPTVEVVRRRAAAPFADLGRASLGVDAGSRSAAWRGAEAVC